jgi:SAM-dependent methyltransferase
LASLARARARFEALPADAPRDQYFQALRELIALYYLADPTNPYQQSGRSTGAERWDLKRRCIAAAIDRDGDFQDVGCANGLLLESLIGWALEKGHAIRPHGIDFVPELVALAQERHQTFADSFETANAFYWEPSRQYDYVRVSLEIVQPVDRLEFAERNYRLAVAPGGRLIACFYGTPTEAVTHPDKIIEELGLEVVGRSQAPDVEVAWCDKPSDERR